MIFITGYVIEYVYYFVECCGYYGYYAIKKVLMVRRFVLY